MYQYLQETVKTDFNALNAVNDFKSFMPKLNVRWFQNQLELVDISGRKLSKLLKLSPNAVSLIFAGKRELKTDEAITIAQLFGVPLEDVLTNAGLSVGNAAASKGSVKIVGWIDATGRIHKDANGSTSKNTAPPPAWGGKNLLALRYRTLNTPLEGLNGAIVYYQATKGASPESFGRMCVITLSDTEEAFLGTLGRGEGAGRYSIKALDGRLILEAAVVESASPVVWMKI